MTSSLISNEFMQIGNLSSLFMLPCMHSAQLLQILCTVNADFKRNHKNNKMQENSFFTPGTGWQCWHCDFADGLSLSGPRACCGRQQNAMGTGKYYFKCSTAAGRPGAPIMIQLEVRFGQGGRGDHDFRVRVGLGVGL